MRTQPFLMFRQLFTIGFTLFTVLACSLGQLGWPTPLPAQSREATNDKPTKIVADLWSTYKMGGSPVGYVRETLTQTLAGDTYTMIEVVIVINRLGNKVEIKGKSRCDETKEREFSRIRAETTSSKQKTVIEADVGGGELTLRSRTGAKDYTRKIPLAAQIVGPEGARHLCLQKLRDKGDAVAYYSFVPELDGVIQIKRKVIAKESLKLSGRQIPTLKIEEIVEKMPGKRTVWLDQEGRVLRQIEAGPFGQTEVSRCDRLTALAAAVGNELPEEMYDQTLVRSNIRLHSPRSVSRVLLLITQKESSLGWPDFAGLGQRVVAKEGSSLILEVAQVKQGRGGNRPVALTPKLREFLEPNAIVQSDDAEVLRIAREVVGDEKDIAKAAGKLRSWVSANMKLDLGIAVAPASEVARNLKGTCMAYSVLLASVLRAAEIPSRVVMGYVYVSGIWGGHAWVEYWTGDRWLPLDAAMPSAGPCDAARLACMKDSLRSGIGPHLGSLLQLYGNVEIDFLEFDIDGRSTKVPAKSKPFTIDGDFYRNPWMGVEIVKPANFRFGKMNATWPDSTILEIHGPEKEVVRVLQEGSFGGAVDHDECRRILTKLQIKGKETKQRIAGRDAIVVTSPGKAALALPDGSDVWIVTVEAKEASTILSELSAKLKLSH